MKKKRYLPFGYTMEDGKILLSPAESALAVRIFEGYLQGMSLKELARQAEMSGLSYRENAASWNKAMIARILDCAKYAGVEGFPPLIGEDVFHDIQRMREKKSAVYGGALNPALRDIRSQICCKSCKVVLSRTHQSNRGQIICWQCPKCRMEAVLTDEALLSRVTAKLNLAIREPERAAEMSKTASPSIPPSPLEREIVRGLTNPKSDPDALLKQMIRCTEEKYAGLQDGAETEQLIEELSSLSPLAEFDNTVFQKLARKILIASDGGVCIQLQNGAII